VEEEAPAPSGPQPVTHFALLRTHLALVSPVHPLWVVAEAVAAGRAAVAPHQHLPGAQVADGLPCAAPGLEEGAPATGAGAGPPLGLGSEWGQPDEETLHGRAPPSVSSDDVLDRL